MTDAYDKLAKLAVTAETSYDPWHVRDPSYVLQNAVRRLAWLEGTTQGDVLYRLVMQHLEKLNQDGTLDRLEDWSEQKMVARYRKNYPPIDGDPELDELADRLTLDAIERLK